MGVLGSFYRLDPILLTTGPSDYGMRNMNLLLVGKMHGQREHFARCHEEISALSPTTPREVPDNASAMEWSRAVGHRAINREATEGAKRNGHGGLAGRHILGGSLQRGNRADREMRVSLA